MDELGMINIVQDRHAKQPAIYPQSWPRKSTAIDFILGADQVCKNVLGFGVVPMNEDFGDHRANSWK